MRRLIVTVCLTLIIGACFHLAPTWAIDRVPDPAVEDAANAQHQDSEWKVLAMLPGIVRAYQQVTLSTPQDGIISEIKVAEGDWVRGGQLLASIDHRVALAAVRLAKVSAERTSAVTQSELHLNQVRRYHERVTQAHRDAAASELELDQALANVEQAEQALQIAQQQHLQAVAELELEEARLAAHKILAPFSGQVSRITGSVGQSMTRSQPLMQLVNLDQLQVELNVPHEYLGELVVGRDYLLSAEAPIDCNVRATLKSIEHMIDAGTGTFRCFFLISNHENQLPAGFAVRLVMTAQEKTSNLATVAN